MDKETVCFDDITSCYEWYCPVCGEENREYTDLDFGTKLTCDYCDKEFDLVM